MTPILLYAFDLRGAGWMWQHAALFSAMIAPTDAVSVSSILKKGMQASKSTHKGHYVGTKGLHPWVLCLWFRGTLGTAVVIASQCAMSIGFVLCNYRLLFCNHPVTLGIIVFCKRQCIAHFSLLGYLSSSVQEPVHTLWLLSQSCQMPLFLNRCTPISHTDVPYDSMPAMLHDF